MAKELETDVYRTLFETSRMGVLIINSDWTIVQANKALNEMLGYKEGELTGKSVVQITYPDDRNASNVKNNKFFSGKISSFKLEKRYLTKQGEPVWVNISPSVIKKDSSGKVLLAASIIDDISSKKRLELAVKERETNYHSLVDLSPDGVLLLNKKIIAFTNKAAVIMLGAKNERELIGRPLMDFVHPENVQEVDEKIDRTVSQGRLIPPGKEKFMKLDGQVQELEMLSTPIVFGGERVAQVVLHDVTERIKSELIEHQRTSFLSQVIDADPHLVFIKDREGRFILANKALAEQYGTTVDNILGKTDFDFNKNNEEVKHFLADDKKVIDSGLPLNISEEPVTNPKTGEVRWFQTIKVPFVDNSGVPKVLGVASDMTVQKKYQDELKKSEEKFRSLFENMLDGFAYCKMIYDEKNTPVDFEYLDVNERFEVLTGLKGVTGKTVSEVIPNIRVTNPELFEIYGRAASDGTATRFETYVDQLKTWFSVSVYGTAKGYFVAVFSNISDRKKSETTLRLSEERYRTLAEAANDMIFVIENDGTISYVNSYAASQFGKNPEDFIGKPKVIFFGEEASKKQDASIEEVLKTDKPVYRESETVFLDKKLWLSTWLVPLHHGDKNSAVLGVSRDISILKESQAKLAEGSARLEAILEGIGDGVFVVDDQGKVIVFNKSAERISQYNSGEVMAKNYWDVLKFVDEGMASGEIDFIREALNERKMVKATNISLHTKTSGSVPVSASAAPVSVSGKNLLGVVVVFRDESAQKEVERIRDEFMMIASHELRAPMTAIKWLVSMLLEGSYGEIGDKLKPPLLDISESTNRLIHLVNDMISVTRIEGRSLKYILAEIDAKKVVEAMIRTFDPEAKNKGITLSIMAPEGLMIQADKDRAEQILANLIDNAIKFTNNGGKIEVKIEKEAEMALIKVADNGVGIAANYKEKLFTKFGQILSKKEGKPSGTGLGLFISREMAVVMGGDLYLAESEIGKGSVFVCKLPLAGTETAAKVLARFTASGSRV